MIRRLLPALSVLTASLAWGGPAAADAPVLEVPVDCRIGTDCFVQNYVDVDPGPDRRDFTCGRLTYDGHGGTDFRVRDLAAMRRGVAVLAAAAGTVARVRDGVEDVNVRRIGREALAGRDAGNAVVIDHGDGWETQYSHLRKGSVLVKPGDRVEAGQPIGMVGLSGMTEFPHVDFGVRHQGKSLDPFVGTEPPKGCGGATAPLWSAAAQKTLAYRATGLLGAGFATEVAQHDKAQDGAYADTAPTRDAPVLSFWVELFGAQPGDRLAVRLQGPDGRPLRNAQGGVDRPMAVLFIQAEAPRPSGGWAAGTYRARFTLTRGGSTVADGERQVEIR